jgi:hypothetical protein
MKYKEYNLIIEAYDKMTLQAIRNGNTYAAKCCQTIIEDLKLLRSQGALGLFPKVKAQKKNE